MKKGTATVVERLINGDPYPIAICNSPSFKEIQVIAREFSQKPAMTDDAIRHAFANRDGIRLKKVMIAAKGHVSADMLKDVYKLGETWQKRVTERSLVFLSYAKFAEAGSQIFHLSGRLQEMLMNSDADNVPVSSLHFPYDSFYLSLSHSMASDGDHAESENNHLVGFFVRKVENLIKITVISVSSSERKDYKHPATQELCQYLDDGIDAWEISFNLNDGETIGDCIIALVEKFAAKRIEEGKAYKSEEGQMMAESFVYRAISFVVNTICFLTAYRGSGVDEWPESAPSELRYAANLPPSQRQKKAEKELIFSGYSRIKMFRAPDEDSQGRVLGNYGTSPICHWRRGHWRTQRYGKGLMESRLRWIFPVIVNRDQGVITIGHRYDADVDDDQENG